MYQYVYSVSAIPSSLTSSGTFNSFASLYTTYGANSYTQSYIDLSTYTTSSSQTFTSGQTYTITDYTSTTTETCDYSVTTSRQTNSSSDSLGSTTTYNYKTVDHSTNGTHSVSDSTRIVSLSSSSATSYTDNCAYNYFDTQKTSGSTDYAGTRSRYTGWTIFHTPFGTHTVSSTTREVVLSYESLATYTQSCDFSESTSIQTTSGSIDYGGYTQQTYISTSHNLYGTHTIVSRTIEIASSNASTTKADTYWSQDTSGVTITKNATTTATVYTFESQTSTNSQDYVGSSTSGTHIVGYLAVSSYSTGSTTIDYSGYSVGLTGVTTGNSVGYVKIINQTTFDRVYYTSTFTTVNVFSKYDSSYYQAEVNESGSFTSSSFFQYYSAQETSPYVENGEKKYTTYLIITSQSSYGSSSTSTQFTTSYGSTRQTSSITSGLSLTTTYSSTVYTASITSTTRSATQTFTTGSSSGTTTQTSSKTYTGFGTTFTTITQTAGTRDTNTSTFSITNPIDWFTVYVRDNGEVLYGVTKTSGIVESLLGAGTTATRWSNDTFVRSTTYFNSTVAGSYYTVEYGSTYTYLKQVSLTFLNNNGVAIFPWDSSNYDSIENAYQFSTRSYNPDLSVWSMKEYAGVDSTNVLYVTYGGFYEMTYRSLNGSTSSTTFSANYIASTETGYERKIKPVSYVSYINILNLPTVTFFATSNTVLKI